MSFSTILFTEKGRALQAKAIAGAALTFTKIEMGSGSLGGQSQVTLSALIDTEVVLAINEITRNSNYATVKGIFSNSDLSTGFYWREIGVFAQDPDLGEVLYCYGNAGALAEYIPSQTSEIIEKVVGLSVIVGNASSVNAVINKSMTLATKEDISLMDQRVDAVEIPIFEDYETGTSAPTPEVALPNIKKAASLSVILQYIKAFLKGTVTLAKISNNLVTTASGLALDARQGAALKALIDALNDNLGNCPTIIGSNGDNILSVLSNAKYNVQYDYGGRTVTNGAPVTTTVQTILYKRIFVYLYMCFAFAENKVWVGKADGSTIFWSQIN